MNVFLYYGYSLQTAAKKCHHEEELVGMWRWPQSLSPSVGPTHPRVPSRIQGGSFI